MTNIDLWQDAQPAAEDLGLVFRNPRWRPPVLEEMMDDLDRLIASIAQGYVDGTCQALHFEELVSEGRAKLAVIISKGYLKKAPSRSKFFGLFKMSYTNHVRSLVQKHRFTQKRTGVKPPSRDAVFTGQEHVKNVEVSLNDEEAGLQVADTAAPHPDTDESDLVNEYRALLTPMEALVFDQMTNPNNLALIDAQMESWLGQRRGRAVKVRQKNMAFGLGIEEESFEQAVLSIQQKIIDHRSMDDNAQLEASRRSAATVTLCHVFGLQVPPNTDDSLVRRMFTVAARMEYDKVDAQVSELLRMVGAKVPEMRTDGTMGCHGVLFKKNHPICNACDLRKSCETEAAAFGLDKIVPSPKLLGANQVRVPYISDHATASKSPVPAISKRDKEILEYLQAHYKRVVFRGEPYFQHGTGTDARYLFCITSQTPLVLRFCSPGKKMQAKLHMEQQRGKTAWMVLHDMPADQVIELIKEHEAA